MPFAQVCGHTFFHQVLNTNSVIVDLGANHGGFSHSMITRFKCRCLALEANPFLCEVIPPDPRLKVLNKAVGAKNGILPFYIHQNHECSSLIPSIEQGPLKEVAVPVVTLSKLLADEDLVSVSLLKVDIEGTEIDVLGDCPDELLRGIPQISVEFHDFNGIVPKYQVKKVVKRMKNLGFQVIRMWARSYGDTLFVNRRMSRVSTLDLVWSRYAVRGWWWVKNFVARKLARRV